MNLPVQPPIKPMLAKLAATVDAAGGGIFKSTDGGDTWSDFEAMGIASPNSPATIERVPSTGDLLLVWNNHQHLPLHTLPDADGQFREIVGKNALHGGGRTAAR